MNKNISMRTLDLLPSVDDYTSRRDWEEACWHKILDSKDLLQLLVASSERSAIVNRAAVLKAITVGKSYREISKEFFVSLQTINSVKKIFAENNYRSYAERSKTERKRRKYSGMIASAKRKPRGRPWRTKYGTIYIP